ncbi:MAG: hypothetical protein FWC85_02795 [Elusimicrobia bacterium]|nr:hypothetical protein [Elusimicrobiota bacterium]
MSIKLKNYEHSFERLKFLLDGVKDSKKAPTISSLKKHLVLVRDCLTCIVSMSCDDIARINGVLKINK